MKCRIPSLPALDFLGSTLPLPRSPVASHQLCLQHNTNMTFINTHRKPNPCTGAQAQIPEMPSGTHQKMMLGNGSGSQKRTTTYWKGTSKFMTRCEGFGSLPKGKKWGKKVAIHIIFLYEAMGDEEPSCLTLLGPMLHKGCGSSPATSLPCLRLSGSPPASPLPGRSVMVGPL